MGIPTPTPACRAANLPARIPRLAAVLFLLFPLTAPAVFDDRAQPPDTSLLPDATALLGDVTAALPEVPIRALATLRSVTRGGQEERTLEAEMLLDWNGRRPSARYTIRDAFGDDLEGLNIVWGRHGAREVTYFEGPRLVRASAPPMHEAIQETDISWNDLSLSFLWWPGGTTAGAETIKGRFCYIVDLPAPPDEASEHAGVRLWIDPQIRILLQAATYGDDGELVKLMEVKSFKRIRDVWVIQNVDVHSFPARHKTSLRVRDVGIVGEEDGQGGGDTARQGAQPAAPGEVVPVVP